MPVWNEKNGEVFVYTYKEGLLAAVGHDLKLAVGRFEVELGDSAVRATFDPTTLRTVCAMRKGEMRPGTLSAEDVRTIDERTRDAVLEAARHPEIRFTSSSARQVGATWQVVGDLALHGRTRPLTMVASPLGKSLVCKARLHQPDFGITPFSALMGTLRIKPHVDVELVLRQSAG